MAAHIPGAPRGFTPRLPSLAIALALFVGHPSADAQAPSLGVSLAQATSARTNLTVRDDGAGHWSARNPEGTAQYDFAGHREDLVSVRMWTREPEALAWGAIGSLIVICVPEWNDDDAFAWAKTSVAALAKKGGGERRRTVGKKLLIIKAETGKSWMLSITPLVRISRRRAAGATSNASATQSSGS